MIKKVIIILLFPLLVLSQNNVCFSIEENPNLELQAISSFTKYINVFNCIHIYAEPSVSDQKVLHAAAIAAELLDNNEDGVVDDVNVQNQLLDLYMQWNPLFDMFADRFNKKCPRYVTKWRRNELALLGPHWN